MRFVSFSVTCSLLDVMGGEGDWLVRLHPDTNRVDLNSGEGFDEIFLLNDNDEYTGVDGHEALFRVEGLTDTGVAYALTDFGGSAIALARALDLMYVLQRSVAPGVTLLANFGEAVREDKQISGCDAVDCIAEIVTTLTCGDEQA